MSDSQNAHERDVIIAGVTAAFLLTDSAIRQMAAVILAARLAALTASYEDAAATMGADVPDDWQPPDDLHDAMRQAAEANARHIADTYRADMEATALAFLLAWQAQHDGSLDGARDALREHLANWCTTRAAWKSSQVAQYETASAADDGTEQFIQELLDGTALDSNGDPIDSRGAVVAILPDYSSPDGICSDYAGETFPLEDYDLLPDYPAHQNCIHEKTIVLADGM